MFRVWVGYGSNKLRFGSVLGRVVLDLNFYQVVSFWVGQGWVWIGYFRMSFRIELVFSGLCIIKIICIFKLIMLNKGMDIIWWFNKNLLEINWSVYLLVISKCCYKCILSIWCTVRVCQGFEECIKSEYDNWNNEVLIRRWSFVWVSI